MTGELPPRPVPARRLGESVQAWLAWFGVVRLLASAVSVAVVVAGVAWLVRSPAPATEAGLPFAGTAGTTETAATLPRPEPPPTTVPVDAVAPPFVHVAGAVVSPGLYQLRPGARVHDAVVVAGGAVDGADLDGLNLAAPVGDGQRVYVPVAGEVDPSSVSSSPVGAAGTADEPGTAISAGPVDVNSASAATLETLPGIGPATAGAIVDDRERHGPFASVDDLERVPGIGPAKLAAIADLVTV